MLVKRRSADHSSFSFEKILKNFRRSFGSDLTAPRFLFLLFTEFLREASLLAFLDVEVPAT
jgi:hypothetical protein